MAQILPERAKRMRLLLPYDRGGLFNCIRENGRIFSEEYLASGILADCMIPPELFPQAEEFKISSDSNC